MRRGTRYIVAAIAAAACATSLSRTQTQAKQPPARPDPASSLAPPAEPPTLESRMIVKSKPTPSTSQLPDQIGVSQPNSGILPARGPLDGTWSTSDTGNAPGQANTSPGSAARNPPGTGGAPITPLNVPPKEGPPG